MHLQTLLDGGAYGSYGAASTFYTGALQTVTYELPRYKFEACRIFTNKPPCGPKRGHGTPQPRFGQEVQLDKIAEKLKLDPAELRLNIVTKPDTLTANWLRVGTIGLAECIRAGRRRARTGRTSFGKLPDGRGVGLACAPTCAAPGLPIYWNEMPHSGVQLQLDRSGQVTVFCGATEIGQGSDDVLAAIVAEVLGIDTVDDPLRHRRHRPHAGRSRLLLEPRHADDGQRRDPGRRARARACSRDAAAEKLDVLPDRVVFSQRPRVRRRRPGQGRDLRRGGRARRGEVRHARHGRLVHAAAGRRASTRAAASARRRRTPTPPASSRSRSIAKTGWIHVPKIWIAHDIGRALNPMLARGQVRAASTWGSARR